jgi:hypothetical protein
MFPYLLYGSLFCPIGSLCSVSESVGTDKSDELSCASVLFSYINPKFRQVDFSAFYQLLVSFLLRLFFDREDGGDMLLRNVG